MWFPQQAQSASEVSDVYDEKMSGRRSGPSVFRQQDQRAKRDRRYGRNGLRQRSLKPPFLARDLWVRAPLPPRPFSLSNSPRKGVLFWIPSAAQVACATQLLDNDKTYTKHYTLQAPIGAKITSENSPNAVQLLDTPNNDRQRDSLRTF